jgi:hypothetical protein
VAAVAGALVLTACAVTPSAAVEHAPLRAETTPASTPALSIHFDADFVASSDQKVSWFPDIQQPDLALRPPPVRLAGVARGAAPAVGGAEEVIIPLPPAAWSGLAGLGLISLPAFRRVLHRFVR